MPEAREGEMEETSIYIPLKYNSSYTPTPFFKPEYG
jgi:hypothetical protein